MAQGNLIARPAERRDAEAITAIYNQGIADRIATFETEPRQACDIEAWFDQALAFVSVEADGQVVAYAIAHPYADRCCYRGIGEFSVYVERELRGLALMAKSGFKEVGVHEKHGKLDGVWMDTVIVERLILENID